MQLEREGQLESDRGKKTGEKGREQSVFKGTAIYDYESILKNTKKVECITYLIRYERVSNSLPASSGLGALLAPDLELPLYATTSTCLTSIPNRR